ncbi:MAG: hypothetical protein JNL32_02080 [Candidatus Kapabacteria bacterium]|nr:hypothetical protein [Candidatus Kapabacteria bacterium]
MTENFWKFMLHGSYVAFVYATVAFGALMYRHISDTIEQRTVQLGEEIDSFYNPHVFVALSIFAVFFCIFVAALFTHDELDFVDGVTNSTPGLIFFVLPQVIAINIIQIWLRAKWQRTSLRTNGFLVRKILSERFYPLGYNQLVRIHVEQESFWCVVRILFRTAEGKPEECSVRLYKQGCMQLVRAIQKHSSCELLMDDRFLPDGTSPTGI